MTFNSEDEDSSGDIKCYEFSIMNDNVLEGTESFTVEITDTGGAIMGAISEATVLIIESESKFKVYNSL